MKKFLIILFLLIGIPVFAENILPAEHGIVKSIEYAETNDSTMKQLVTVKILSGKFKSEEVLTENILTGNPAYDILLSKGDRVILHVEPKVEFIEDVNDVDFFVADMERSGTLYLLTGIFFCLLLIIGRKKVFTVFCLYLLQRD